MCLVPGCGKRFLTGGLLREHQAAVHATGAFHARSAAPVPQPLPPVLLWLQATSRLRPCVMWPRCFALYQRVRLVPAPVVLAARPCQSCKNRLQLASLGIGPVQGWPWTERLRLLPPAGTSNRRPKRSNCLRHRRCVVRLAGSSKIVANPDRYFEFDDQTAVVGRTHCGGRAHHLPAVKASRNGCGQAGHCLHCGRRQRDLSSDRRSTQQRLLVHIIRLNCVSLGDRARRKLPGKRREVGAARVGIDQPARSASLAGSGAR